MKSKTKQKDLLAKLRKWNEEFDKGIGRSDYGFYRKVRQEYILRRWREDGKETNEK